MRGWLIERLMCNFGISSRQLTDRFGARADEVLREADRLIESDGDGLLIKDRGDYRVTELGRPFVRSIATRFDAYFGKGVARHSVSV